MKKVFFSQPNESERDERDVGWKWRKAVKMGIEKFLFQGETNYVYIKTSFNITSHYMHMWTLWKSMEIILKFLWMKIYVMKHLIRLIVCWKCCGGNFEKKLLNNVKFNYVSCNFLIWFKKHQNCYLFKKKVHKHFFGF